MSNNIMLRGALVFVDFGNKEGSIQSGVRPAIVIPNDNCNTYSPVIQVTPLTTRRKKKLPVHVEIQHFRLKEISTALVEQTTLINKEQIVGFLGYIDQITMSEIDEAIEIQMGLRNRKDKIDYDYIETLVYLVNEADEKYSMYKDKYFLVSKKSTEKTLENYCKKYNINYEYMLNVNKQQIATC